MSSSSHSDDGPQLEMMEKEEKARNRLCEIIRTASVWGIPGIKFDADITKETLHDEALELMTEFPTLAKEEIPFSSATTAVPTLLHFVHSSATHDQIVRLYDLHPEAVEWEEGTCFHYAARNGNLAPETLVFLLEKYPKALTNKFHRVPFIFSLLAESRNLHSIETLKKLMDLDPSCHGCTCRQGYYPLSYALLNFPQEEELLEYMMEEFPKKIDELRLLPVFFSGGTMRLVMNSGRGQQELETLARHVGRIDETSARMLHKFLSRSPKMTRLLILGVLWSGEGLCQFVAGLKEQHNLQALEMSIPRRLDDVSDLESFGASFADIACLKHLTLQISDEMPAENAEADDELFQALTVGIARMPSLVTLQLFRFCLSNNNALMGFVADGGAPKVLTLHRFELQSSSWDQASDNYLPDDEKCRLEKLEATFDWNSKCAEGFCNTFLPRIPTLRAIRLYPTSSKGDITSGVVRLLKTNTSLHTFLCTGLSGNTAQICEALESNKTLKFYSFVATTKEDWQKERLAETLAYDNRTLMHVALDKNDKHTRSIHYWTRLNEIGRKNLDHLAASPKDLVKLLCHGKNKQLNALDCLNSYYGLLQERPCLWSFMESRQPSSGANEAETPPPQQEKPIVAATGTVSQTTPLLT